MKLARRAGTSLSAMSSSLEEAVYMADKVLLLSRAPTRIADYPDVPCPRPRTPETLVDPVFTDLRGRCLEVFQREVRRS